MFADVMLTLGELNTARDAIKKGQEKFRTMTGLTLWSHSWSWPPAISVRPAKRLIWRWQKIRRQSKDSLHVAMLSGGWESRGSADGIEQVTKGHPDEARAWFGLGTIASEREELRKGRELLTKARDLNPDGPGYEGALGLHETLTNDLEAAKAAYTRAVTKAS